MTAPDHLPFLRRYLDAVSRMAVGEELASYYDKDAIQEEYPNKITPVTARRTLPDILAASERGKKIMASQSFEILNFMQAGDKVAVEMLWTGTLSVPVASIPAGGQMKARFGVFIEMRDGKILSQRNYDCFEPF